MVGMTTKPPASTSAPVGSPAPRVRRMQHLNIGTSTLLLLLLFGLLNYLAFRHYKRWDWTAEQLYTLSSRTQRVLKGLKSPVSIYVFLSESEPNFSEIKALLERYQHSSRHIAVHLVDPDRRPAEFEMLAKRFGIMAGQMLSTGESRADAAAVVASADQRWIVQREDLVGYGAVAEDADNADALDDQLEVRAERAMTGAIVQVTEGRPTQVCVAQGHGEWNMEPTERRSLFALADELKHDNVEMKAMAIRRGAVVEGECHALLVVGPRRPFQSQEADVIANYLKGGGNVLLALDPILTHEGLVPSGLEHLAEPFGIQIENKLVIERDTDLLPQQSMLERFFVVDYGEHTTTRGLNSARIPSVMHQAQVIRVMPGSGAQVLAQTSSKAVAVSNTSEAQQVTASEGSNPEKAEQAPLSVAAASILGHPHTGGTAKERSAKGGKLIVVGDSDWLSQTYLDAPELANLYLASAWTGWLAERQALISIPPKRVRRGGVDWSVQDLNALWWRLVILLPLSSLVLGFFVWWRRRS